jgi:hypothetical protein
MSWGDFALRLLLRARDRETISGDLLEEYREHVLPANGPVLARLWYLRQILSFVTPAAWGLVIGVTAGLLNLIDTAIEPLADDTASGMIAIVGALMAMWTVTSAAAGRRTQCFRDAVTAGMMAGLVTMVVVHLAAVVRVNLFLDQIQYRNDWVNLVSRFQASRFESLRTYANYEYIRQWWLFPLLGAAAGGVCGTLGGAFNRAVRAPAGRTPPA